MKYEREQAGLLFGGISNILADISYELSSQKSAPTHPLNVDNYRRFTE